jgi:putative aldouronate transport system permease protein
LHEVTRHFYKRTVQTITYALYFLSWIVFGGLMLEILGAEGLFNRFLTSINIQPIGFLTDSGVFQFTLISTDIWKNFGMGAVLYLAALSDVDVQLYEAAAIDGAGRWDRLFHITLPGIAPTVTVLFCLNMGFLLDAGMQQILVLYNPVVYSTGDVLSTFVYRIGITSNQFSLAATVGLMQSVVGFFLIILSYYLARRLANYRIF